MNITETGKSLEIAGKTFTVGGRVFSHPNSDYPGLFGTVQAICSGDECGKNATALYVVCDFNMPESTDIARELLYQQAILHKCELAEDDLELNGVAMPPEMLEPIPMMVGDRYDNMPYILICTGENCEYIAGLCGSIAYDMGSLIKLIMGSAEKMELVLHEVSFAGESLIFHFNDKEEYMYAQFTIMRAPALYMGLVTNREANKENESKSGEQQRTHRIPVRKVRRVLPKSR